jgi:hypothetical protein
MSRDRLINTLIRLIVGKESLYGRLGLQLHPTQSC